MRRPATVFAWVLVGCATAPGSAPSTPIDVTLTSASPDEPLPAGVCGFNTYLSTECGSGLAQAAVIVRGRLLDGPSAERALARVRSGPALPLGYPFAVSHHDLFVRDARDGVAVVLGTFTSRAGAAKWSKALALGDTEIVDLVTPDEANRRQVERGEDRSRVVVEVVTSTAAWDAKTLEALAAAEPERKQRELARGGLTPTCTVERGHVHLTNRAELYRWNREYAPVLCNGRTAWIPWRSTRLESVVTRTGGQAVIHQVIDVTCDAPTVEDRPFGVRSGALLAFGHCPG